MSFRVGDKLISINTVNKEVFTVTEDLGGFYVLIFFSQYVNDYVTETVSKYHTDINYIKDSKLTRALK